MSVYLVSVALMGFLPASHARPFRRSTSLDKAAPVEDGFNSTSGTRSKSSTYDGSAEVDEFLDQLIDDKDENEEGITNQGSRRRRWWRPNLHFPILQRRRRRRRQAMQKRMLSAALQQDQLTRNVSASFSSTDPLSAKFRRQSSRLLDVAIDRFLSKESATAVRTIRHTLANLEDHHGVVDIFGLYSPKDILLSALALSRLQSAAEEYERRQRIKGDESNVEYKRTKRSLLRLFRIFGTNEKQRHVETTKSHDVDVELLEIIAHYAKFAVSAYGWKGRLALGGRFHRGDVRALEARTGISRRDIIDAKWRGQTHRPAYFIIRDVERKTIVLSVRGTWSPRDVLTDLCAVAQDYEVYRGNVTSLTKLSRTKKSSKKQKVAPVMPPKAHQGMVQSAREIAQMTNATIGAEMSKQSDYQLVIVGHSLGGGIASVLGSMWREIFPNMTVIAYGCPCVGPMGTEPTSNDHIISIVAEGDPFSCLSIGHLADLSTALSRLCDNTAMRNDILRRKGSIQRMADDDLKWCVDALDWLKREYMRSDKLYPPGRIMLLRGSSLSIFAGSGKDITLQEATAKQFRFLKVHARMLDLSRHIPTRYESALEKIWEQHKTRK